MEGRASLAEVVCGRCGTRAATGAQTCAGCGQSLAATVRPTGVTVLAMVEVAIGIVGLIMALDLLYWADWRFSFDEMAWGAIDGALLLAYIATSMAAFKVASGFWSLQVWAWRWAVGLSCGLIGLVVFSVIAWGLTTLDVIGLTVHLAVLAYLNLKPVRALFGRPPLALFEGQS